MVSARLAAPPQQAASPRRASNVVATSSFGLVARTVGNAYAIIIGERHVRAQTRKSWTCSTTTRPLQRRLGRKRARKLLVMHWRRSRPGHVTFPWPVVYDFEAKRLLLLTL